MKGNCQNVKMSQIFCPKLCSCNPENRLLKDMRLNMNIMSAGVPGKSHSDT